MNWDTWIRGKTIGGLPGCSLYRVKNKTDVLKIRKFLEMLEFWPGQNWGTSLIPRIPAGTPERPNLWRNVYALE